MSNPGGQAGGTGVETDGGVGSAAAGADEPTVLHVDDDPQVGQVVADFVSRAGADAEVVTETDARSARRRLDEGEVDCLVADVGVPGTDGVDLVRQVGTDDRGVPVVVFTRKHREEVADELPAENVAAYVRKTTDHEQFEAVADAVARALGS